jgi:hypothetical protein
LTSTITSLSGSPRRNPTLEHSPPSYPVTMRYAAPAGGRGDLNRAVTAVKVDAGDVATADRTTVVADTAALGVAVEAATVVVVVMAEAEVTRGVADVEAMAEDTVAAMVATVAGTAGVVTVAVATVDTTRTVEATKATSETSSRDTHRAVARTEANSRRIRFKPTPVTSRGNHNAYLCN